MSDFAYVAPPTGPFGGEGAYGAAAFPSYHAYPAHLPRWMVPDHVFTDVGTTEETEYEQGEARARALYTFAPQIATVYAELDQDDFDDFWDWYEGEMRAGGVRFDTQLANQGGTSVSWWTAQFIDGYRWSYLPGGDYAVSADLLLVDGPYASRTAPGLEGQSTIVTVLEAAHATDGLLRGNSTIETTLQGSLPIPPMYGISTIDTMLTGDFGEVIGGRLLENGPQRTTEGGDQRVLEQP